MKFKNIYLVLAMLVLLTGNSCSDFLNTLPNGTLATGGATPESADALVTAAYAGISNEDISGPMTSMWGYSSVRSDDAYKGGGGISDIIDLYYYETYKLTVPDQDWEHNFTWENFYWAISRANSALNALNELTEEDMPEIKSRMAEARFLRAHSHFVLKILFKYIPYITEDLTGKDILEASNRKYTNDELWDKIAEDFQYAIDFLPETQSQIGRVNKYAAIAYLAKLRLYQAYEQDENNQVVNINKSRLEEVVSLSDVVINSGKYSLEPDYANNFMYGYDHGPESIFAIEFSISDGTSVGRVSYVTGVNYPHGAPQFGCCGFHQPSQNMVNAFGTDENGLPKFDTFNDVILDETNITPNGVSVDPRIDHAVAIDGHPFKYRNEPDYIYSNSWVRDPGVYGFFHSMKEAQPADITGFYKNGPFIGTSKNIDIIRYDDVLLMKAEALIELGKQDDARPIINLVRERAASSTTRLVYSDGSPVSNYKIGLYNDSNLAWTQDNARMALRWERRLELALESSRFFDLVRWGIAEQVLNDYLKVEKERRDYLSVGQFTAGRDEYYPIPQQEIDFTKGLYIQNVGYN
ncbi:MAG: RagB/SusD family nutrient uptake outer membrane protein [Prolixibacteraceae bacterium]